MNKIQSLHPATNVPCPVSPAGVKRCPFKELACAHGVAGRSQRPGVLASALPFIRGDLDQASQSLSILTGDIET